jgi:hypothetical protein
MENKHIPVVSGDRRSLAPVKFWWWDGMHAIIGALFLFWGTDEWHALLFSYCQVLLI